MLWAGVIYALSSMPNDRKGLLGIVFVRRFGHVFEYFLLSFLIYVTGKKALRFSETGLCALTAAAPIMYALSDEFHQSFVPTRLCCMRDIFIDMVGILCFFMLLEFGKRSQSYKAGAS